MALAGRKFIALLIGLGFGFLCLSTLLAAERPMNDYVRDLKDLDVRLEKELPAKTLSPAVRAQAEKLADARIIDSKGVQKRISDTPLLELARDSKATPYLLLKRVRLLQAQIEEGLKATVRVDPGKFQSASESLDKILSRSEFRRRPDYVLLATLWFNEWLRRHKPHFPSLEPFWNSLSFVTGNLFDLLLLGILALMLALILLYTRDYLKTMKGKQRSRPYSAKSTGKSVISKDWLADEKKAIDRGDFALAMKLRFQRLVAEYEEHQLLHTDTSYTFGEYRHAIARLRPSTMPFLKRITATLNDVVYGGAGVSKETHREFCEWCRQVRPA